MSLLGEAAVAIWHDIAPEGRDEFYAWHAGEEHMPERIGVRGFLARSARYAAVDHANANTSSCTKSKISPCCQARTIWQASTIRRRARSPY